MKALKDVSSKFNIPIRTLEKAAKNGRIPAEKPGRDWFIHDDKPEFLQFVEKYRQKKEKK